MQKGGIKTERGGWNKTPPFGRDFSFLSQTAEGNLAT